MEIFVGQAECGCFLPEGGLWQRPRLSGAGVAVAQHGKHCSGLRGFHFFRRVGNEQTFARRTAQRRSDFLVTVRRQS